MKPGRESAASLSVVPIESQRRTPKAPAGLTASAAKLWEDIAHSLHADFFRPGDLPLLEAYCVAADRKRWIDAEILRDGMILDGDPHPGLKMSRDEAGLMATLAVKLRLCQSSRTRPDNGKLKAAHSGARPWDDAR